MLRLSFFLNDLKSDYPDGLPRATTLYRHIADKTLKMMSVYGNQFPTRREGRQNCSILLQGPVRLNKIGSNYQLSSNHVHSIEANLVIHTHYLLFLIDSLKIASNSERR